MLQSLNWFEIPTHDLERAGKFYGAIFGFEGTIVHTGGQPSVSFPNGGSLNQGEGYIPSATGVTIYIDAGEDLSNVLSKVEAAGGTVLLPKFSVGANGFIAFFKDTEGNKIGLHSTK